MAVDLILGTAGHIDHGKTALVRALTGVDTDRLPEEKRRGISIDLGFALLELPPFRLGIVDCPGHERFVRNMLAGTTGVDLALLVVAADDSIMPQTREHLDILTQLELSGGVIALTKCDLADAGRLRKVENAIRELTRGGPLAEAAIVRTSVLTGEGLSELRDQLHTVAERAAARVAPAAGEPFRMAIDRAFAVAGHGTVVTGTISKGCLRIGDVLAIEPGAKTVRVRGLHNHDQPAGELHRGHRGAINLAGIHHDEVRRGQELCTPGFLVPAKTVTAHLQLLDDAPALKNRSRVRLHVGTAEVLASVRLLGADRLESSQSGLVQFYLAEPAVTVWNQPFVIRRESPMQTLGGGRILDPAAERIRRLDDDTHRSLRKLQDEDAAVRAGAALYLAGLRGLDPADLARMAGVIDSDSVRAELLARGELVEVATGPGSAVRLHRRVIEQLSERMESVLTSLHARQPLRAAFPQADLAARFAEVRPEALTAALAHLERQGKLRFHKDAVALAGRGPQLSRGEQQLLDNIVETFRAAGISTPSKAECVRSAAKNKQAVEQLLDLAVSNGQLVAIGPDYWLHAGVEADARQKVAAQLAAKKSLTVSQIRELLGTTRKYAVPLCEYWDKIGFTIRRGDQRVLTAAQRN